MRFQSASVGRSAGRRRPALSLAKDFSIGLRSSEYFGKWSRLAVRVR